MNADVRHDPALLLASASPRRRRLLAWLGTPYEMTESGAEEDLSSPLASLPPILVRSIARDKALAARRGEHEASTVVACDTIVVLDRKILGKPADLDEAFEMLRKLSGRTHSVVTGVAIMKREWDEPRTFAVTTEVHMRELGEEDLRTWARQGELLGCAGAYNIESHLASVDADECYQNVAGLPLCHLYGQLKRAGYTELASPVASCEEARGMPCELGRRLAGVGEPG